MNISYKFIQNLVSNYLLNGGFPKKKTHPSEIYNYGEIQSMKANG